MPENEVQLDLFNGDVKTKSVLKAVDSLNDKFGDFTITWGSSLKTSGSSRRHIPCLETFSGVRNTNIKN